MHCWRFLAAPQSTILPLTRELQWEWRLWQLETVGNQRRAEVISASCKLLLLQLIRIWGHFPPAARTKGKAAWNYEAVWNGKWQYRNWVMRSSQKTPIPISSRYRRYIKKVTLFNVTSQMPFWFIFNNVSKGLIFNRWWLFVIQYIIVGGSIRFRYAEIKKGG